MAKGLKSLNRLAEAAAAAVNAGSSRAATSASAGGSIRKADNSSTITKPDSSSSNNNNNSNNNMQNNSHKHNDNNTNKKRNNKNKKKDSKNKVVEQASSQKDADHVATEKAKAPAKKTPSAPTTFKTKKKDILLAEILALGGTEDDFDLIKDALSESEAESGDERSVNKKKENKKAVTKLAAAPTSEDVLLKALKSFMTKENIRTDMEVISETDVDMDAENEKAENNESDEEEETVPELVEEKEKPAQTKPPKAASAIPSVYSKAGLKVAPVPVWHESIADVPETPSISVSAKDEPKILSLYERAKKLYTEEVNAYEKFRKAQSPADRNFVANVLKSGTTTDKVSALTLLIQESPLHTLPWLRDHLVNGMARKHARREALLAIDAIKDLIVGNLLLDSRKLLYFRDQPELLAHVISQSSSNTAKKSGKNRHALSSAPPTDADLILWYFEDSLKSVYFEFLKLLESLSHDPLPHLRSRSLVYLADLLIAKPEQEQNLLSLLTNKLGDRDPTVSSRAAHVILHRVLESHPVMKEVVGKDVERVVFRDGVSEKTRRVALGVLTQIPLGKNDKKLAGWLVGVYFAVFERLVSKAKERGDKKMMAATKRKAAKALKIRNSGGDDDGDQDGGDGDANSDDGKSVVSHALTAMTTASSMGVGLADLDAVDSRIMALILTGVNRAFPYADLADDVIDQRMNSLFAVCHVGSFATSVQALSLIFQVQNSRLAPSDRFYRTLYDSLHDRRLLHFSRPALFLNLLHRALRADPSEARCCAILKRLLQISAGMPAPFTCGALFLAGDVAKTRPGIWGMIKVPEDSAHDGDVEKFVDVDDEEDDKSKKPEAGGHKPTNLANSSTELSKTRYDGRKRDPLHAKAEGSCLWELNPKKVASIYRSGHSLMQPKPSLAAGAAAAAAGETTTVGDDDVGQGVENRLIMGGKKRGVVFGGGDTMYSDEAAVNSEEFKSRRKEDVPVDEMFFHEFFAGQMAREGGDGKNKKKRAKGKDDGEEVGGDAGDAGVDSEEEGELDEDEVWEAMQRSVGFNVEADAEDDIDMDDVEMDDDDEEGNDEAAVDDDEDDGDNDLDTADAEGWEDDADDDDIEIEGDEDEDDDEEAAEETEAPTMSKTKARKVARLASKAAKLGFSGTFGDSDFACYDDFEELIERGERDGREDSGAVAVGDDAEDDDDDDNLGAVFGMNEKGGQVKRKRGGTASGKAASNGQFGRQATFAKGGKKNKRVKRH